MTEEEREELNDLLLEVFRALEKEFPGLDPAKWREAFLVHYRIDRELWEKLHPEGNQADWEKWCEEIVGQGVNPLFLAAREAVGKKPKRTKKRR